MRVRGLGLGVYMAWAAWRHGRTGGRIPGRNTQDAWLGLGLGLGLGLVLGLRLGLGLGLGLG